MRVINISLSELETKMLMIGFEGENQITQVRIDAAEILTDYPNATPTLIVKPLFGFAYPVIVSQEGTDVVWEIDNSVLSFHGDGEIQLTFTEGSVIAKSYVGRIRIKRSLTVTGEAPDPIETWEQAATAKLAEVDAQIGELEDMVEAAEAAKDQAQNIVDDAAADIQAAGAAQVGNVNAAGTTQVGAVQAKGEEVRESIPQEYSTLSNEVADLRSDTSSMFEYESKWSDDIFDADAVVTDVAIDSNPAGKVISYANAKSLIFPLEKNVKYKIVKNIGNRFRVAVYQGEPEIDDMPLESLVVNNEVSEIEYSCNGNDIYLIVYGGSLSFSCYIYKKELILKNSIMPEEVKKIEGVVVDVSNNIFSSDMLVEYLALDNNTNKPGWSIVDPSSSYCSVVVPMTYGKTYTVTQGTGDRFRVSVFDHVPKVSNDVPVEVLVLNGEATTYTYKCQNDGYYLIVYGNSSGSSFTMSVIEEYRQVNHDYLVTLSPAEEEAIQNVNTLSDVTQDIYSENMYVLNAVMDYSSDSVFYRQYDNYATIVFPLRNGAEYTVNRLSAPRFRVSVFDHKPESSSPDDKDYPVTVLNKSDNAITSVYYRCVNDGYYMAIYGSMSNQNLVPVEILENARIIEPRYLPRHENEFVPHETFNQFVDETRGFEQEINTSSMYAHIVPAVANSSAVTRFIAEMNKKAAEIGMTSTVYADVAGYETAINRTTARDMVKLGISALSYPELCRAWGKMEYTVTTYNDTPRTITAEYSETNYSTLTAAYKVIGRKPGYMSITGGGFTCTMLGVCIVNGKAVIGYCAGMVDRPHRPLAMKELMDIVKDIMDNGSTSITPQNFTNACAAILPEGMPASWEQQTIETIYELNADEQIVPASTAKVMTAIVMLENIGSLHDKMTVLSTDGLTYGSGQVLQDGDIIDYKQALYLMMLLSSGPCCRVVARTLGTVMLNAYDV